MKHRKEVMLQSGVLAPELKERGGVRSRVGHCKNQQTSSRGIPEDLQTVCWYSVTACGTTLALEAARRFRGAMCLLIAANEMGSWALKEPMEGGTAELVSGSCFPWLK